MQLPSPDKGQCEQNSRFIAYIFFVLLTIDIYSNSPLSPAAPHPFANSMYCNPQIMYRLFLISKENTELFFNREKQTPMLAIHLFTVCAVNQTPKCEILFFKEEESCLQQDTFILSTF